MATPAAVLREYLIDLTVIVRQFDQGNPPGSDEWCSTVGKLPPGPDYPDNYVAVMDQGARMFAPDMRANDTSQHPVILFNFRALNYLDAFTKGQEIEEALKQIGRDVLESGQGMIQVTTEDDQDWVIRSVGLASPTIYVGQEATGTREVFSLSCRLDCEQVTPQNYRSIYPDATPGDGDSVIGIHNGRTSLFPITAFSTSSVSPEPAHFVYMGPQSGSPDTPTFRALATIDMPSGVVTRDPTTGVIVATAFVASASSGGFTGDGSALTFAGASMTFGSVQFTGTLKLNNGSIFAVGSNGDTRVAGLVVGGTTTLFGPIQGTGVTITADSFTINNAPSVASDAVRKDYVDGLILGTQTKPAAAYATTGALASNVYNNGAATLTASANGALANIDGQSPNGGDLVLVKNEGTASHNGLYTVTTAGDGASKYVLTRHGSMNSSTEFGGALIPVENGTANASSLWMCTANTPVLGTDPITFVELNKGTDLSQGTGITISGNTVSLTNVGPGATGPTGASTTIPVITINAQGQVTALTTASITVPTAANPTGTVGNAAVNGVAATFMRSDAAPALSATIQAAQKYSLAAQTLMMG